MILDQLQQQQQQQQQTTPTTTTTSTPSVNFTSSQVVLQVGEKYFGLPRESLQRHRHSVFEQVLQQVDTAAQKGGQSGVITIVRSSIHFPVVVQYLTGGLEALGKLSLRDVDVEVLEEILVESDFYRLPELSAFIKAQLRPELTREVVEHLLKGHTAPRDFTGARLVGLDLSNLNFVSVEIKGKESKYLATVVHHCDFKPLFSNANLQWANFSGSRLQGSRFNGARLSFTNFTGATLDDCVFEGARLSSVNLNKASLAAVDLRKVILAKCDFTEATLARANLSGVVLAGEPPSPATSGTTTATALPASSGAQKPLAQPPALSAGGCDFTRATFTDATLVDTDFSRCVLKGARFADCQLQGALFSGAQLEEAVFEDCDLTGATFTYANLKGAKFLRCMAATATFNHANMTFSQLFSTTFDQAQLVASNLQCAELFEFALDETEQHLVYRNHASFKGTNFRFAQLQGVDFHRVDCSGADFRDANLTNAVMRETVLQGSNVEGATLKRRVIDDFEAEWTITKKGKTMEDGKFSSRS